MTDSGNWTGGFGSHSGGRHTDSGFADTDWFTPVTAAAPATATATLNSYVGAEHEEDFRAWRSEFPDYYGGSAPGGYDSGYGGGYDTDAGYSSSLTVTPSDVRTALGPEADDLMAAANVDIDELIRLINAETTVLPVIPDELSVDRIGAGQPLALPTGEPAGLAAAVKRWKATALKATIAAVLVSLIGGGAAAIAMNKSVTVDVDGQAHEVSTYADTVGELLEDEGLAVSEHDSLSPSPNASIGDGGKVVLQRGRQLHLTIDGEQRHFWVRATTVGEALKQLSVPAQGAWLSEGVDRQVPLGGLTMELKTAKNITLFDGGTTPKPMTTTAVTVDELMKELSLTLGPEDTVSPKVDLKIVDGAEVRITRNGVTVINQTEKVKPPVKEIEDETMDRGEEVVVEAGAEGERIATYRIKVKNGKEVSREEIGAKITKQPKTKVVKVGTKQPPVPVIPDGEVWDRLAQCEAGGNWAINTGNGYYGGLQFNKSTWDSNGGGMYAEYPHQASREQQIAIATKVRDARGGYSAWPACSRKLGLPR